MEKKQTVDRIISLLGGRSNIVSVTNCMTRLRIVVINEACINEAELKNVETVLAVIHDRDKYYEVVVGPGNSRKYADICHENGINVSTPGDSEWTRNKVEFKSAQKNNRLKEGLNTLGDIFVPLIPGVIAAGLCAGFGSFLKQLVPNYTDIIGWHLVYQLLSLINVSFLAYITAWAGYRAAERFGATPILGGMLGMITSLSNIDEIARLLGLYNEVSPLSSILRSGKGGILAVICGVYILSVVEKFIRRRMSDSLDIVFTPLLTLIFCVIPYVLVVMPVFGYVSGGIVWVLSRLCMSSSLLVRVVVGYLSSALFLPMVATGMHHGMVALYSVQLQELGYVTLFPALAMAGAGQVGAAIAIYAKAKKLKHRKLCSVVAGALPAGFLGIGEPLIYGVTLPMGLPFITAGLGAGFGGAFVMAFQVAATAWGTSGLLAVFVMTAGKNGPILTMCLYLAGLLISYIMSYLITGAVIRDETVAEALGGIEPEGEAPEETEPAVEAQEKIEPAVEAPEETEPAIEAPGEIIPAKNKSFELKSGHRIVKHGELISFDTESNIVFSHQIKDPLGIHVRPAGELVKLVEDYDCAVMITKDDKTASGKSIMELLSLCAVGGSLIEINVSGRDAETAVQVMKQFMDEKL